MSLNVDECYIEILRLVKQAGSVSRVKLYIRVNSAFRYRENVATMRAMPIKFTQDILRFLKSCTAAFGSYNLARAKRLSSVEDRLYILISAHYIIIMQ